MSTNIDVPYEAENLAAEIADMWAKWDSARNEWRQERQELREYLFATDTRKTTNSQLPWKNSTVTPKLTQLRDNLHANYMASLFPNDDWFVWEAEERTPAMMEKKKAITAYMKAKLKASDFQLLVSQLVYDYIDYGNVIAGHEFVADVTIDEQSGHSVKKYVGPRAIRVNPIDVVFNPNACSFQETPIIRRVLKSIGDLIVDSEQKPFLEYNKEVIERAKNMRTDYRDNPDLFKNEGLLVDGFGSFDEYVNSNMVELLEFWGNIYDPSTGEMHRNVVITVLDRKWILRKSPNKAITGAKPFFHCGWRLRSDNLWAQGPLDQLIGMQYRIDHLENLKADVFDQIAHPVIKVIGTTVEEFTFGPGEMIFTGDEGDVEFIRPDTTALNADLQIREIMERMEELAGAPRQAMGIRTPGEKTKYEVQTLENATGRIFQAKVAWFEKNILEPLLNSMLAEAARGLTTAEQIKTVNPDTGAIKFFDITKEDLVGTGKIYPLGARHFAEDAKFVQELSQTLQIMQQIPTVAAHVSGKAVAKALEDKFGWSPYNVIKDNAAVIEQAESQRLINQLQEDMAVENQVDTSGVPPDGGEDAGNPIPV